jgi:integral membrane protein (TIGR01906 family)
MKNKIAALISWIVAILFPAVVMLAFVRLLLTPFFPAAEYRMPGFPDDPYGFTQADRLKWSDISIDYLLNNENAEFFSAYQLPDGSPLYNERELSHMDDVKVLVHKGLVIYAIVLAVFLLSILLLVSLKHAAQLLKGLRAGGWLLIGIMLAILFSVALDFSAFFTWFHTLFFQGDSWIFYYSDTFIRLFPLRFWSDAFIYVSLLSLIIAVVAITQPFIKKKTRH